VTPVGAVLGVVALVLAAAVIWPGRGSGPESEPVGSANRGDVDGSALDGGGPATVDDAADALVLCALALRSGLGVVESMEAVASRLPGPVGRDLRVVASAHRWGQDARTAWSHVGEQWRSAALAWQAAESSGAAPAEVLLAAADRMRRAESTRVETALQRAGVLLVLPLGACFLPGFVGTTVVPVVLHLARSTLVAEDAVSGPPHSHSSLASGPPDQKA